MNNTDVIQFYNLSHIFISLIGAVLLLSIYYNIRQRFSSVLEEDKQKRVDRGLLYLSLAMFIWVLSGTWAYFGIGMSFQSKLFYSLGINFLSIVNNLFLLLALYYFDSAPEFIYKNKRNVLIISVIIIVVSIGTIIFNSLELQTSNLNLELTALPDLLLSGLLSVIMMVTFYRTFQQRDLPVVAIISCLIILLIFISQLPEVFISWDDIMFNYLLKIISKTGLIILFLVLATSWVIQLANTPRVTEMQITFEDWSLIQLTIPSKNIILRPIDFGSKTTQFKNLMKLALRRKFAQGDQQCILVGGAGEIKNQTYLSRIVENINDILELENEQKLERKDLFTFIGEGKYRLRILPSNIELAPALLSEFVKGADNEYYKSICS